MLEQGIKLTLHNGLVFPWYSRNDYSKHTNTPVYCYIWIRLWQVSRTRLQACYQDFCTEAFMYASAYTDLKHTFTLLEISEKPQRYEFQFSLFCLFKQKSCFALFMALSDREVNWLETTRVSRRQQQVGSVLTSSKSLQLQIRCMWYCG